MDARTFFWLITCLLLSSCSYHKYVRRVTIPRKSIKYAHEPSLPPITIWVHGTRFFRRPLFHGFFKSTPGLRLAKELAHDYYLYNVVHGLNQIAPQDFPLDTFYLFGWSGKLRATIREEAAEALYEGLKKLIADYRQQYGVDPFIRLITHSHGGTVALNLARVKESDPPPFYIDELIMLACPVQNSTKGYLEDDMFRRIYSLYSSLDLVQILAPQIHYYAYRTKKGRIRSRMNWPLFSNREFAQHPKLSQVRVKINGRALFHSEFTRPHFTSLLPHILQIIDTWHYHQLMKEETHLLCVYTDHNEEIKPAAVHA